jgi:hypothetical protein
MSSSTPAEWAGDSALSLESLSEQEVSTLCSLKVVDANGEWSLILEDRFRTLRVEHDFGHRGAAPALDEIQAVLGTRRLTFRDEDWKAWAGFTPNRTRHIGIGTAALVESLRAKAAAAEPQISTTELAWANWLTVIGALTAVAAAVDASGTSYSIVRFLLCGISVALIVLSVRRRHYVRLYVLGNIALAWNPVFLIHMPRSSWLFLDWAAVAVFVAMYIGYHRKKKAPNPSHGWDSNRSA